MTSTQKISAKNLSFDDLCLHTKGLINPPQTNLYESLHAHLDALFISMRAASPYAKTHLFLNETDDVMLYGRPDEYTAHARMSSPWLRQEDDNVALLKSLGKQTHNFMKERFLQYFPFESLWHDQNATYTRLYFNDLRISIDDDASAVLSAFFISAIHASFYNGRTRDEMVLHKDLHHSFFISDDINDSMIDSMGTDEKDAKRVYREGLHIAKTLASKFSEFSVLK